MAGQLREISLGETTLGGWMIWILEEHRQVSCERTAATQAPSSTRRISNRMKSRCGTNRSSGTALGSSPLLWAGGQFPVRAVRTSHRVPHISRTRQTTDRPPWEVASDYTGFVPSSDLLSSRVWLVVSRSSASDPLARAGPHLGACMHTAACTYNSYPHTARSLDTRSAKETTSIFLFHGRGY